MISIDVPSGFQRNNPVHWLAFGLGSGLLKPAPGTWGSAMGLLIYVLLFCSSFSLLLVAIIAGFIGGIYLCEKTSTDLGVHDHGGIVWDEFVGVWIALIPLHFAVEHSTLFLLLAFALFRVFDIVKPWPIAWFDKNTKGGLGIMIDDVIAGVFAAFVVMFIAWVF